MSTQSQCFAAALFAGTTMMSFASNAAEQEEVLFNCFLPAQHYYCTEIIPEIKNRIEAATEGRVTIIIPPKSLAAPQDQYEGVLNGVMDGGFSVVNFLTNQTLGLQLLHVPFIGREHAAASASALHKAYTKYFAGIDGEFEDVELIGFFVSNGNDMFSTTDKPIESIADLASRKIYATAGTAAEVIKPTGASVISGPAIQMLESISNGLVDGFAGAPWSLVRDLNLTKYTSSGTFTQRKMVQATFALFINADKWKRFSEADQIAIHAALGEDFSVWAGQRADERYYAAREFLMDAGVEEHFASPEFEAELVALSQPRIDAWIEKANQAGVDGQEVIEFFGRAYEEASKQYPEIQSRLR